MTVLHFAAFYYCWIPKHVAFAFMKAIRDYWWLVAEGAAHFLRGGGLITTTRSNPRGKKWEKMDWPSKGVLPLVIRTIFSFKFFQFVVFCCHTRFIFHNTTFTFTPVIGTFWSPWVYLSWALSWLAWPFPSVLFLFTLVSLNIQNPWYLSFAMTVLKKRWKLWKYSRETLASYQMDRTIFVVGRLSFDKP